MAIKRGLLLFVMVATFSLGTKISATLFTIQNLCSYPIWPGTLSGNGAAVLGGGGFALAPGASTQFSAPPGWSGRFWARTGCNFDASGNGKCATGDCGGVLKCTGGGVPPATLVEFTVGGVTNTMDFYDVSLVDGFNVAVEVKSSGGTGDCKSTSCLYDVNRNCPAELQVKGSDGSSVVACKSACLAFNTPEYCCSGDRATPDKCPATRYSKIFKDACPSAYSYAYDDKTSTFTCTGGNYLISFCRSAM